MEKNALPAGGLSYPPHLWQNVAHVFTNRHAIVSEAEILDRHAEFDATQAEVAQVIEWAKTQQLVVEAVDEPGCLRLTPQGRRLWRELMGEV